MTTHGIPISHQYSRQGLGMFIHFNMATFGAAEQGDPNTSPNTFNPTALSIDNWVLAAQNLGAKYAVLTVKHSDGFCLWPTATTPHNITNSSPWYTNSGNIDITSQFVSKFNIAGIKPMVYFTIGDATFQQSQGKSISQYITYGPSELATLQSDYNQATYLTYIQAQLTELLTNYPVFGIWIDAGYYALANTYYPWASSSAMLSFIRGLRPSITIVNNSHRGITTDTDVMTFETGSPAAGGDPQEISDPIQANNSWFWHGTTAFKTTAAIVADFQLCAAANCSLLLDCPPDNTGVIPTGMMTAIQQIGAAL